MTTKATKLKHALCSCFLILICVFSSHTGVAQEEKQKFDPGVGVEGFISFNGHGAFLSGYGSLNSEKHSLKLGPMLQARSMRVNGLKFSYSYIAARRERVILADEPRSVGGPLRFGFFTFAQYIHNGDISVRRVEEESVRNPESTTDWKGVKLSTIEGGAGFELSIRLSRRMQLRNFMGLSVYYHLDHPEGMYHEQIAPTLIFGTGLNIPRF
jgi:hypothetical protein